MTAIEDVAQLCFVQGNIAYFTTLTLGKQWGDDWGMAPYENHAGTPHAWESGRGLASWEIIPVIWEGNFNPASEYRDSTHFGEYSVDDINGKEYGVIPWLFTHVSRARGGYVTIMPGTTLSGFIQVIRAYGGDVYTLDGKRYSFQGKPVEPQTFGQVFSKYKSLAYGDDAITLVVNLVLEPAFHGILKLEKVARNQDSSYLHDAIVRIMADLDITPDR